MPSCSIVNVNTKEPIPFFKTNGGEIYDSFKEALDNSSEGDVMSVVFLNTTNSENVTSLDEFNASQADVVGFNGAYKINNENIISEVASIPISFNPNTKEGWINSMIKNNILSDIVETSNGERVFSPYGETIEAKKINAFEAEESLRARFGQDGFKKIGNSYIITEEAPNSYLNKQGKFITDVSNVNELTDEEQARWLATQEMNNWWETNEKSKPKLEPTLDTEESLRDVLSNFLTSTGISVMGMKEYKEKYKAKFGDYPSSKALADIANKVVAIQDGVEVSEDVLTEEVAHFIIEGMNQDEVVPLLEDVIYTDEYRQHAERYRQVYSNQYSTPEEVDNAVKREILGKSLAKSIQRNFTPLATEQGFFSNLWDAFVNYYNKLVSKSSPSNSKRISDFNNRVAILLRNKELSNYMDFNGSLITTPMYALSESSEFYSVWKETTDILKNLAKTENLRQFREINNTVAGKIENLERVFSSMSENSNNMPSIVQGMSVFSGIFHTQVRGLLLSLENKKDSETFTAEENTAFNTIEQLLFDPLVQAFTKLKGERNLSEDNKKLVDRQLASMSTMFADFVELKGQRDRRNNSAGEFIRDEVINKSLRGSDPNFKERVENWINGSFKDTSWLFKYFGQTIKSHIPQLAVIGKIAFDMYSRVADKFQVSTMKHSPILAKLAKKLPSLIDKSGYNILHHINSESMVEEQGNVLRPVIEKNLLGEKLTEEEFAELKDGNFSNKKVEEFIVRKQKENAEKIYNSLKGTPNASEELERITGFRVSEGDVLSLEDNTRLYKAMSNYLFEKDEAVAKSKGKNGERTLRKIQLFKKLNLSNETYQFLNEISSERSRIEGEKVKDSLGFIDPTNSINARLELEQDDLKARRNEAKSLYDSGGNLKEGLTVHSSPTQDSIRISDNLYIEYSGNSYDGKVAFDLQKYDSFSRTERERAQKMLENGVGVDEIAKETNWRYEGGNWTEETPIFEEGNVNMLLESLSEYRNSLNSNSEMVRNKQVFQFFKRNGSLAFTREYFTDTTNVESIREVLERNRGNITNSEYSNVISLLTSLAEAQTKLKERLRLIQSSYDFRELDEAKLNLVERDDIKSLNNNVSQAYSDLNEALDNIEKTYPTLESLNNSLFNSTTSEREVNTGFITKFNNETGRDWDKASFEEKKDFLLKENTDERATDRFNTFRKILKKRDNETPYQKNRREEIWRRFDVQEENDLPNAEIQYLISKLPPYHKRTAPKGYSDMITSLEMNGVYDGMNIEEIINQGGVIEGVEPRASYRFQEQNDLDFYRQSEDLFQEEIEKANLIQNKNERLLAQYKAYLRVAGRDTVNVDGKFLNKEFFSYYGMKDLNSSPTKNIDMFEATVSALELKRVGMQGNKILNKNYLFEIPQYERSKMERLSKSIKDKGQVGRGLSSLVLFREEDEDYQLQKAQDNINRVEGVAKIPKTGIIRIKNSDLSSDLYHSYLKFAHDGILYNERANAVDRAIAVRENLNTLSFEGGKKDIKNTNAYQMATNTINAQFYGQRHMLAMNTNVFGRNVDLSKMVHYFRKAVSWAGLGYSVPVAVTSLATATINKASQRLVKYHLHNSSSNWANKEFLKLFGEYASATGKNYSNSQLDVLGQRFGVYNQLDRAENSIFGGTRHLLDVERNAYAVHNIANVPVGMPILLSKLREYRLIDGRFINYSSFKEMERVKGTNRSEIERKFDGAESSNLHDFLKYDKGVVEWNSLPEVSDLEGGFLKGEALAKYLQDTLDNVQADTQYNVGLYDGLIHESQTTEAQRHPLASFLMLHKGWLSTSALRMLGREGLNLQTGNFEEGVLRTTFARTLGNILSRGEDGKYKISLKDWNKNFTEAQNANIRMAMVTAVQIASLIALASVLMRWADDDDEKDSYSAQLSALLATRVLGESMSSSFGIFSEIYSTTDSPVSALTTVNNFVELLNFASMGEEVTRGQYRGDNKWATTAFKLTAFKNLHMFEDPEHIRDVRKGFIFFNTQQNLYSPYPFLKWINEPNDEQ